MPPTLNPTTGHVPHTAAHSLDLGVGVQRPASDVSNQTHAERHGGEEGVHGNLALGPGEGTATSSRRHLAQSDGVAVGKESRDPEIGLKVPSLVNRVALVPTMAAGGRLPCMIWGATPLHTECKARRRSPGGTRTCLQAAAFVERASHASSHKATHQAAGQAGLALARCVLQHRYRVTWSSLS